MRKTHTWYVLRDYVSESRVILSLKKKEIKIKLEFDGQELSLFRYVPLTMYFL